VSWNKFASSNSQREFLLFHIVFIVMICRFPMSSDTNLNLLRTNTQIQLCSDLTIL
jgi:hypothetical protein